MYSTTEACIGSSTTSVELDTVCDDRDSSPLVQLLSTDELYYIVNFLPVSGKVMLACTCRAMFQCISSKMYEKYTGYDNNTPLTTILNKAEGYSQKMNDNRLSQYNELKSILERGGSFHQVTRCLNLLSSWHDESVELMNDLFSMNTGNSTKNIVIQVIEGINEEECTIVTKYVSQKMGHTLKKLSIKYDYAFQYELLEHLCNLESLEIALYSSNNIEEIELPESATVMSKLKKLFIHSEIPLNVYKLLAQSAPNLEVLHIESRRFPDCFAKYCPHLKEIVIAEHNFFDSYVDDEEILSIVRQFKKLRHLAICSSSLLGTFLNSLGQYAKNLEYLSICRTGLHDPQVVLSGGKMESLKVFELDGSRIGTSNEVDLNALFQSVVDNCPNIQMIEITCVAGETHPNNLYGVIPTPNVIELNLYRPNEIYTEGRYEMKGRNAIDVIMNMENGWEEIAHSDSVTVVTIHYMPSKQVLQRCNWINATTLSVLCSDSYTMDSEWLLALLQSCPNMTEFNCDYQNVDQLQLDIVQLVSDGRWKCNYQLLVYICDCDNIPPSLKQGTDWEWKWFRGDDDPLERTQSIKN
jgi:hypothetical protein